MLTIGRSYYIGPLIKSLVIRKYKMWKIRSPIKTLEYLKIQEVEKRVTNKDPWLFIRAKCGEEIVMRDAPMTIQSAFTFEWWREVSKIPISRPNKIKRL